MHEDDSDARVAASADPSPGEGETVPGEPGRTKDAVQAGELSDDALSDAAPDAPRWADPDATGHRAVDDALADISRLDVLATAEHVPVYESAHRRLQDALADLDDR